MKKQHIILTKEDRKLLTDFLSKGTQKVRVQKRAIALQMLDNGKTFREVQKDLQISYPTVVSWAEKYRTSGLEFLQDKPRSGRPLEFDGQDRAKVTALACSEPPMGYARWSLRLLKDRLVSLEILPEISYSQVGIILKKTNYSPIEKNSGVSEP
jgi:transposase